MLVHSKYVYFLPSAMALAVSACVLTPAESESNNSGTSGLTAGSGGTSGASYGSAGSTSSATTGGEGTGGTGTASSTSTGGGTTSATTEPPVPLPPGDGVSPAYLGIELSYYSPSSNTALFLQHLGVNEARQFVGVIPTGVTLQKFMGASFGTDVTGRPVTTAAEFLAAAAALRTAVNPFSLFPSTQFVLSEMQRLHINYLAQMHIDTSAFDFSTYDTNQGAYWQERFGYYTYMYYFARRLLDNQVTYFETSNEPDIELGRVNSTVDRILLTSQAVRAAAADDPNRPQVKILGPVLVTVGVPISSTGWLPEILERVRETIPAGQGNVPAIDVLAYHRYGGNGSYYASLADAYKGAEADKGFAFPLAITEYSTSTGRGLDGTASSTDDPSYASNFLSQTSAMLSKVSFINGFTFGMRIALNSKSGVAKNGVHWVDYAADSVLHNVGGPTRSGEAFALIARHFGGSKPLYTIPGTPDWVTTADAHHVYILSVNNSGGTVTQHGSLAALPSALKVASGAPCFIDGVSAKSYGQVAASTALDKTLELSFTQPGYRTWLVTIPREHSTAALTNLVVQHDNVIKAGSDAPVEHPSTLRVAATNQATAGTSAAVLQFSSASLPASWVGLHLTVSSSDPVDVILHVYGFPRIGADAEHLTWENSGLMNPVTQDTQVNGIADNLLNYQSAPSPSFLGSVFVPASSKNLPITLNVTDFANANTGTVAYVIVREFLNNGTLNLEPGPDVLAGSAVTFAGSTATDTSQRPMLQVLPF